MNSATEGLSSSFPQGDILHVSTPSEPAAAPLFRAGFVSLLAVRILTVTTDNLVRWLVIGLGKRAVEAVRATGVPAATDEAVLAMGTVFYVLPFILLAWLAGWLADRFMKRSIVIAGKFAEVVIALLTVALVAWGTASGPVLMGVPLGVWLLMGAITCFSIQTTLLNPSLVGTIAETVPAARLSAANGVFAMVSLAATLAGMAVGNWLADVTWLTPMLDASRPLPGWLDGIPWAHVVPVAVLLGGVTVTGWLTSFPLPRVPAANPLAVFPRNAITTTFRDLRQLLTVPRLAGAAGGTVFFWALAAVAQLNVDQYAKESGATTQVDRIPLLIALVTGIGLGSLIAGRLSKRGIDAGSKVDLGLVPAGGFIMTVACAAVAFSPTDIFGGEAGTAWRLVVPAMWLALLGIGAGMFDVPLEAYLQEQSPPQRRGTILASTNLLVFTGMLLASVAYYGLRVPVGPPDAAAPLFSARGVFAVFAVLSLVATAAAVYAAPRASLRMFVRGIVCMIWRFQTSHEDRVPQSGPLVIVANHLSWLDGFLLPLAAPRPVRMVVYGPNIQGRFLNMLADQWRFILFDPKPKSIGRALKTIQGGLADGDCVGIFCEGGISRTGQILGFKRGLEWLLERVESPILPASIDGMWGSLLSYSEGRYFSKWPRGFRRTVTLTFGQPLPVGTSTDMARRALQELVANVVRKRMAVRRPPRSFTGDWPAACAEAEAFDGACLLRRTDCMLVSLAAGDPLHATLGTHGQQLLGIATTSIPADTTAADIARKLVATKATMWLARVDQVEAVAKESSPNQSLAPRLVAVVMPIATASDLPWARHAAERFREAHGVEPVVAYCPREAGCLISMNTPPARAAGDFEVTSKPDTLGRVLNGSVVWPRASERSALRLPSLASDGIPDDAESTLVISAMVPCPATPSSPGARLLSDALDVDKEGFLVSVERQP
jgi:acyl-[acyl-carrier-protein]-phospholipid O-acyltransferase/long-chain-fatty-acid--[acyl-carrier-protein] ligase